MKILGIDTSCDETAAAVVEDGRTIISNVIASQVAIHARYGGIVPEVASRQHVLTVLPVLIQALGSNGTLAGLDAVAVTYGPGLAGSLIVGVNVAKAIALSQGLPLVDVNHLESHIYANWLIDEEPVFPNICLIVSGGHTDLLLMTGHGQFRKLGQTRDDAAGEAFDKGSRILGLGYPGGPAIEAAAERGVPSTPLPRAWLNDSDDFSFSGLKTALLHLVRREPGFPAADAAASFQEAIVEVLVKKTLAAARKLNVKQVLLSGGVAANSALRKQFLKSSPVPVLVPPRSLCTDNAAMVAACAYFRYQAGSTSSLDLDVAPGLSLGD